MNQCACDCHKSGTRTILLVNPPKQCCNCHSELKFTVVTSKVEVKSDIEILNEKLEAQQKEIYRLKEIYWEMSNEIAGLKQQRDIGIERINKLESDFSELKNQTLWIDEINKRLDERVDRIDTRIYQFESKLAQQDIRYAPKELRVTCGACNEKVKIKEIDKHDCAPPHKKTKTLWIAVDNRRDGIFRYETTQARESEQEVDRIIEEYNRVGFCYSKHSIEIEVPE